MYSSETHADGGMCRTGLHRKRRSGSEPPMLVRGVEHLRMVMASHGGPIAGVSGPHAVSRSKSFCFSMVHRHSGNSLRSHTHRSSRTASHKEGQRRTKPRRRTCHVAFKGTTPDNAVCGSLSLPIPVRSSEGSPYVSPVPGPLPSGRGGAGSSDVMPILPVPARHGEGLAVSMTIPSLPTSGRLSDEGDSRSSAPNLPSVGQQSENKARSCIVPCNPERDAPTEPVPILASGDAVSSFAVPPLPIPGLVSSGGASRSASPQLPCKQSHVQVPGYSEKHHSEKHHSDDFATSVASLTLPISRSQDGEASFMTDLQTLPPHAQGEEAAFNLRATVPLYRHEREESGAEPSAPGHPPLPITSRRAYRTSSGDGAANLEVRGGAAKNANANNATLALPIRGRSAGGGSATSCPPVLEKENSDTSDRESWPVIERSVTDSEDWDATSLSDLICCHGLRRQVSAESITMHGMLSDQDMDELNLDDVMRKSWTGLEVSAREWRSLTEANKAGSLHGVRYEDFVRYHGSASPVRRLSLIHI